MNPQTIYLKDDGVIPNSKLPLLVYRNAFSSRGFDGASWLERCFESNGWTNSWRNGVFSYHHYHSNTHEVLGVYSGSARLKMGGEQGETIVVHAGDILVIPAGVSHKNLESSPDFRVVGAYPDGSSYDLMTGMPGERPGADRNIASVPVPDTDPLTGREGGLTEAWEIDD